MRLHFENVRKIRDPYGIHTGGASSDVDQYIIGEAYEEEPKSLGH